MRTRSHKSSFWSGLLLMISASSAFAQHQHGPQSYASATSFADLPAPPVMKGIGTASIKITTKDPKAQQFFDQGLNLLHAFWDLEAYRAFREASRIDPSAPMAWWGVYNSLAQNSQELAEERAAALKKAIELMPTASDREQYYIRSIQLLAEQGKGRAAWVAELEALISKYPNEVEAQLLIANALASHAGSYLPDGRPREGKMYGRSILQNLLRTNPEHAAVHHYWIHASENGPRPEEALDSAAKLTKLAPNSGHLIHMPGHIYYRLGMYDKAREAFVASLDFDLGYMRENKIHPINNWNYTHNLDYLVANSAEQGRYKEAEKYARMLAEIPSDAARVKSTGLGYMLYGGDTALVRLRMRFGMWDDAAAELQKLPAVSDALSVKYKAAILAYLKGMNSIEKKKDVVAASSSLDALEKLSSEMAAARGSNASDWYFGHATRVVAVHLLDLRGSLASLRGEHDEAIRLLNEAVTKERDLGYWEPPHYTRPVLESLGEAYIRAGKFAEAAAAYEKILATRPNSGFAFFGMARLFSKAGDTAKASDANKKLQSVWQ
ncbi:MAG: tetratricopeptide repeat protein, partial [Pyrinomonadaceae bacterium]